MTKRRSMDPLDERNTKRCRKCGELKSVVQFGLRKRTWTLESRCMACKQADHREWYAKNRRCAGTRSAWNAWPAELNAKLAECIAADMSAGECAAALGRTIGAVTKQRQRRGLPAFTRKPRKWPPRNPQVAEHVGKVAALRAHGLSYRQVAEQTGFSRGKVAGIVHHHLTRENAHS